MTHKGDLFKKHLPSKQVCHGGMNLYVTVFENS